MYLLRCRNCPAVYIGETGRAFRTRINEHISAYTNNNPTKSAFSKHLIDEGHYAEKEASILYNENRTRRRLALESIAITKINNLHYVNVLNNILPDDDLINKVYSISPFYTNTEL